MTEYIMQIDHPELCSEYGGTNYTDRLERIVRCRDCKHSNTINDHVAYCNYDPFRPLFVKPDGFCYRGKANTLHNLA